MPSAKPLVPAKAEPTKAKKSVAPDASLIQNLPNPAAFEIVPIVKPEMRVAGAHLSGLVPRF